VNASLPKSRARDPNVPSPIRVLTLNLWGIQGHWAARRGVLKEGLRSLSPDVIAFQESVVTHDYDQAKDLLSSDYEIVHQEGRSPDGTGNSIASRAPLGEVNESFLHATARVDPNHGWIGSVAAVEIYGPSPFLLVHLKPSWQPRYERERELQAIAAARFIDEVLADRDLPVVLTGDFDAAPDTTSIEFWKGEERPEGIGGRYVDTWEAVHPDDEGHTFTPRNPLVAAGEWRHETGRRIDYIFVKEDAELQVMDCFLAFNERIDGVWASDHFGVVADLQLRVAPLGPNLFAG
jgi:endonuclease/exonuclease/phosphatase family metal-dependent hydrolase